ncbi:MAG TPA: hypothetical protein VFJ05_01420, partial [Nitrososphaeraceae archaeon]|nr:hypothetical protein [Nitrososphaeraceae archaeon]
GFEGIRVLGLKDNVEAMNKSSSNNLTLYHSGDLIAKYLLDRGQIRKMPDFDEIIDARFVNTIFANNSRNRGELTRANYIKIVYNNDNPCYNIYCRTFCYCIKHIYKKFGN